MHPLSTVLLLLGYGLSMPIGLKLSDVVGRQNHLALLGHQAGLIVVIAGWVMAGRSLVAVAHAVWMALVRVWYWYGARTPAGTNRRVRPKG